jgi:hypothetical protein
MKRHIRAGLVFGMFLTTLLSIAGYGQALTNAEVPGDHFSLEGALELFKKSSSPEEFERLLNVPDSKVNNLDLNGDGLTDYIRVIDRYDGHVHAFILQAVISPTESQDVAVIELEKFGNGKASLQIVGDPDIYGIETIIEPTEEVRTYAGAQTSRATVNVWSWPCVQYVWDPYYSVWISPWGWYSRPVWWNPWRPVSYVVYRPYWDPYRPYYSRCHFHRNVYAHRVYIPVRTTSVVVYERHRNVIVHSRNTRGRDYDIDRNGRYRDTDNNRRQSDVANNNGRSGRSSDNTRRSYQESGRESRDIDNGASRSNGRTRSAERDYTQPAPRDDDRGRSITEPRSTQRSSGREYSQPSNDRQSNRERSTVTTPQQRSSQSNQRTTVTTPQQRSSESQSRPSVSTPQRRSSESNSRPSVSQPSRSPAKVSTPSPQRSERSSTGGGASVSPKKRGRD